MDESVVSGADLSGEGLKPESPSSGDKNSSIVIGG